MNGHLHIVFAPLLPAGFVEAMAAAALLLAAFALWRRARGAGWRAGVLALFVLALCNPSLIEEQRTPLKDTVLVAIDDSASMRLGDRMRQTAAALDRLTKKLAAFDDLDMETLHVKGATETDMFGALAPKLAAIPNDRLAGVVLVTDGEVHDGPDAAPQAPLHALIAGKRKEADRRIAIVRAPAYGIVGKKITLTLRVDDTAAAKGAVATVAFRRDSGESENFAVPVGKDFTFEAPVVHAGPNLLAFSTEPVPDELTALNNSAAVTVNGVRDRLRVLLVSGEPHIGGRTWRNFLKADPAVDLVHFTILRSPAKFDATSNKEMSLIAFPVHELFEVKLQSFDLVIFDRFRQQSLVPESYLENIANYVEHGGALLVSNAADEGIPPLTFSPLARVLPTEPTGRLLTGAFVPDLTEAGRRHPVTDTLEAAMPRGKWGPWFRQLGAKEKTGEVLMTGRDGQPLLVLAHAGEGRVAQFLSDQFWLWARDYNGGGPQAELLKRIAHWLVQEPELDETALRARAEAVEEGWRLVIEKRDLHDERAEVTVTGPDGQTAQVTLHAGARKGILEGTQPVSQTGLYRLKDGRQEILVMAGPENAPEFNEMRATEEKLKPFIAASGGGASWLEDYPAGPDIRRTSANAAQHGRGWIGLRKNGRYRVTGSKAHPLWPAWLVVVLLLGFAMGAWRKEGKS